MSEAAPSTIGIDVGATNVRIVLVDGCGRVRASHRQKTVSEAGPAEFVRRIAAALAELPRPEGAAAPAAVGVGIAGYVDAERGLLRYSTNLGWKEVPLRAEFERAFGLPVHLDNDVRAAMWAEWQLGAGGQADDLLCLFVGTGIGGGVITGGKILEGFANTAGELGHMTLVFDGRPCRCPNRGCLEAYASGWAIAARAREAVQERPAEGKGILACAGAPEQITAAHVGQAFAAGDPLATRLVEETGRYLGSAVVGLVNIFNPSVLVLGGGVVEGIPSLVAMTRENVLRHALGFITDHLQIRTAALGGLAGAIGAALLARQKP